MENSHDIDNNKTVELFTGIWGITKEGNFKELTMAVKEKEQEVSHLTVQVSELRKKLKKKNAEHQLVEDNLKAEITELKCQKQLSTVSELLENAKPSNLDSKNTTELPYQKVQLLQNVLELCLGAPNDTNLKEQISELERKIDEQSPLANQVAELQRKVEEQSILAAKVTELEGKIEQKSDMEGRILKLERQSQKNNLGAKVSELDRKVEELSHLTARVSNLERKSDARNTVNELSLSQLSVMIEDLQLKSIQQSRQIRSGVGKKGQKKKSVPQILCFYHNKFGANALKCQEPCDYTDSDTE